jgi:cytochrome c553
MLPRGREVKRTRPLAWPAALAVLILSIGMLGDTCRARDRKSNGKEPAASASLPAPETKAAPAPAAATPTSAATFAATVAPILAVKCAPCHNPGGKMYDRLPFDRWEVVASHAGGVRRRLKDEDLKALEAWLATLPPAMPVADRWAAPPGR